MVVLPVEKRSTFFIDEEVAAFDIVLASGIFSFPAFSYRK
jgi:hypothetical protein